MVLKLQLLFEARYELINHISNLYLIFLSWVIVTNINYWIIYAGSFSIKGDGVLGRNYVEVFSA
jgi:hypothetical protein